MIVTGTPVEHGEILCKDCGKNTYMIAASKYWDDGRVEHICYGCFYHWPDDPNAPVPTGDASQ